MPRTMPISMDPTIPEADILVAEGLDRIDTLSAEARDLLRHRHYMSARDAAWMGSLMIRLSGDARICLRELALLRTRQDPAETWIFTSSVIDALGGLDMIANRVRDISDRLTRIVNLGSARNAGI